MNEKQGETKGRSREEGEAGRKMRRKEREEKEGRVRL